MMRLVDVLGPYVSEAALVIDHTPASLHVGRQLFPPAGVEVVRATGPAAGHPETGPGTMTIVAIGPDPDVHGDPDVLVDVLAHSAVGGRVAILFGWQAAELPYHRVLEQLAVHHCQVLEAAAIDELTTPLAVLVERVDRLAPFRDVRGRTVDVAPEGDAHHLALDINLVNSALFAELSARGRRVAPPDLPSGADRAATPELARQQAIIRQLEAKIAAYEGSASLRVGRAIVGLARPFRTVVLLPIAWIRGVGRGPR